MTAQFLQFIREELKIATADLSGGTKGQLQAWLEDAQFDTGRFKRKRIKVIDAETGKLITLNNPPVQGKQSHAKGSSIALIQQIEYRTASWRRALFSLDAHQKAWLLWNYSEDIRFEHQTTIARWAWSEFKLKLGTRKVAGKTMERLKPLIWLAAQDVSGQLAGRDRYQYTDLAALVGVKPDNWSKNYSDYWRSLCLIFERLDSDSLLSVSRIRSQQKITFSQKGIAKVN
ncbi:antiterminator [Brenneria goodwinii]|uniref:Antiterminator-like protein n=1 Tax=Brenneria goodwinii TaxID=1109412 RepID=A0A0G4K1E3_9GAMM|nr:bacteriophage antitermination protein Q [Brenneria goodwinii]MCG8155178.1 antiterminator [Brenneria goodwinii]MCG8159422.1 antiterminator [Brenneria goodwinii]MCG8164409.1 antiterminator [Brenneria goodwinii]MCG8169025.1 antiterminator [Brenneria goodwinii]MCG8173281.1 antiterminator [Brenneria goodwinii]